MVNIDILTRLGTNVLLNLCMLWIPGVYTHTQMHWHTPEDTQVYTRCSHKQYKCSYITLICFSPYTQKYLPRWGYSRKAHTRDRCTKTQLNMHTQNSVSFYSGVCLGIWSEFQSVSADTQSDWRLSFLFFFFLSPSHFAIPQLSFLSHITPFCLCFCPPACLSVCLTPSCSLSPCLICSDVYHSAGAVFCKITHFSLCVFSL